VRQLHGIQRGVFQVEIEPDKNDGQLAHVGGEGCDILQAECVSVLCC